MIVKKVPTSKKGALKNKAHNVRALVDYIAGPKAGGDGEKVEHRGAQNLLNVDHDAQVQEMIDLAEVARRSPQPVQHWIISWREGEQLTAAKADAAVATFLVEMGLGEHQAIYALHRDTRNCHVHLAVNRVHPETERVVTVNNGFDHEVAHRAIARIERDQGWQPEGRALFVARPNGDLERSRTREERELQPSGPARDFEERVGERSAQRIALEVAAPIMRRSRDWRGMHEELAREGIRFERTGSGAVLWIGDEVVKASSAGRDCSMAALQKRFGELAVDHELPDHKVSARAAQPLNQDASHWREYAQERERRDEQRTLHREGMRNRQRDEWRLVADRHRREREDLLKGSWKGHGDLLNATRSQLAARQARDKADLRDEQRLERERLQQELVRFPVFKDWLAEKNPELAQERRYRERRAPTLEGPTFERAEPHDIRAFEAVVEGGIVHYRLPGRRGPAFIDRGRSIEVADGRRPEAVLAALQLGAQKWESLTVYGDRKFRQLCVALAVEHGFKLENPELQREIALAKERALPERPSFPRARVRSIADAYRLHLEDVVRESVAPQMDPSRFDSEVAVRLRLTGHHRDTIFRAIREGGPASRPREQRDWDAYARRVVDFAFGVPGSQLAHALELGREHLLRIEGRRLERERLSPERGR